METAIVNQWEENVRWTELRLWVALTVLHLETSYYNCTTSLKQDAIFSSPVRRTESYSDTPGVSVKVLVFGASYFFLSNVFIYHTFCRARLR